MTQQLLMHVPHNPSRHLLTYSLHTAVLLEKLTGFQLVKKFPAFYGTTRRFITACTRARRLSLFLARSIQSMPHIPLPEDPS
jgi:hypothetical protein